VNQSQARVSFYYSQMCTMCKVSANTFCFCSKDVWAVERRRTLLHFWVGYIRSYMTRLTLCGWVSGWSNDDNNNNGL
jgi:hypothetical protein